MGQIRSYKDLKIWQRGMDLAKGIYVLTRLLPKEELFCLTAQMRRAAVSIPSNVAEGHAKSRAHFCYQLSTAMGSIAELETQLTLAGALYPRTEATSTKLMAVLDELGRMIRALSERLGDRQPSPSHSPATSG